MIFGRVWRELGHLGRVGNSGVSQPPQTLRADRSQARGHQINERKEAGEGPTNGPEAHQSEPSISIAHLVPVPRGLPTNIEKAGRPFEKAGRPFASRLV